jgi:hypothetical protein
MVAIELIETIEPKYTEEKNHSVAIQFFIIPRQLQLPVSAGNSKLVSPGTIRSTSNPRNNRSLNHFHNKFHQAWMPWRNLHAKIAMKTLPPSSVVQKQNRTRQAEEECLFTIAFPSA